MANVEVKKEPAQPEQARLARRMSPLRSMFSLSPSDLFSAGPFELMRQFTDEMDRAFENFGLQGWGRGRAETVSWTPTIEVFERDKNLIVHAELPGLNKDDVKVEVTEAGLVIKGERKREDEEKGKGYYRSERSYGHFYRLIPLPADADIDQIKAHFNNGILEVSVPVPQSHEKRREIPIEVAATGQS